jgi:hypothetical protein
LLASEADVETASFFLLDAARAASCSAKLMLSLCVVDVTCRYRQFLARAFTVKLKI